MTTATTIAPVRSVRLAPGLPGRLFVLVCLLFALSCIAGGAPPANVAAPTLERSVKAAFLYKFLGYVEFPSADAGAPLTVGVVDADDVAAELGRITAGRTVSNRVIAVRTLNEGDALAGLNILFVGADTDKPAQWLRAAQQHSVLGISETDSGLQQGAVINFRVVDERVRFEVSLPAAEKSNLKLSSRLLSVAYQIQKGP
nr:YfiR family protein [Massilia sp. BJB1822]